MRLLFLVCGVLSFLGCRAPSTAPRLTPLDFDALPGPKVFSAEATLADRWMGPLKASHDTGQKGSFKGVGDVDLAYLIHRVATPKAAVVLITGRTEPVRKYAELIDDLNRAGYSTFALDHRGQGASGRMLPNPQKGYVASFDDYVTDLHTFVTTVVKPETNTKVFLIAHSMGGAVALLAVDAFPDDFAAVVTTAEQPALMTVYPNDGRWDTSNVEFEAGILRRYSKSNRTAAMRHIDYGLGLLRAEAFKSWMEKGKFDLADLYGALVDRGDLIGYEVPDRFYEIGSPEGLRETDEFLRRAAR